MCLAVPGRIIELKGEDPLFRLGMVDFGGIVREINLSCVPEAGIGDYVVVHVGIALSRMEEEEALRSLDEMRNVVLVQESGGSGNDPLLPQAALPKQSGRVAGGK